MKQKAKIAYKILLLLIFMHNTKIGFCITRTWTGIGAGGAGTDFNNVANWTGGGALSSSDDLTINWTTNVSGSITLSGSITINSLVFNMNTSSGSRLGKLMVGAYNLTINSDATFNAVRYSNIISYDELHLDISTGGNVTINGTMRFHTNGNGDTYLTTNDLTGSTTFPGTLTLNGGLYVGAYGRTVGTYEPNIVLNGSSVQLVVLRCVGGAYMFKSQDLTFGSTNSPSVTIRGSGSVYFDTYDGNMTIGANTNVIVPDTTIVNRFSVLDRYNTGAGTMVMGANSTITTGCPNVRPMNGFATYNLNSSSTVVYNSSGWQDMMPITYGHVICDGASASPWKYSNGVQTMQGNFTVQNGAIYGPWSSGGLTINGNTVFQSSGIFNATRDNAIANITHTLKGNYTNNASFTSGSPVGVNTILFNSSTSSQSIGGTSVTTFYNLTIDNTSGLNVTLNQNENVANVWTLTNAPFDLNSFTLTVQNTATTAIVRTNGYAISETNASINNSKIQWNMTAANTGAHVYPFGVSGTYIPFTFNKTSTSNAVNVAVSTRATATSANTPWAGISSVAAVTSMMSMGPPVYPDASIPSVIDRWWDITASAAVTANLIFSYRGVENTTTLAPTGTFAAQHWNGSSWDPQVGTGTGVTAGVGTVSVTGASTFSPWVLSSNLAPLPIELVNFTSECSSGKVVVKWTTTSETNNNYFTLEKSNDGITYYEIATINGAGNSTQTINYSCTDNSVNSSLVYYRLKQTDYNGQSKIFNTISLSPCGDMNDISVGAYSNNNGGIVVFIDEKSAKQYQIVLFDALGKKLKQESIYSQVGKSNYILDVNDLSVGIYFISIECANNRYTQKVYIR